MDRTISIIAGLIIAAAVVKGCSSSTPAAPTPPSQQTAVDAVPAPEPFCLSFAPKLEEPNVQQSQAGPRVELEYYPILNTVTGKLISRYEVLFQRMSFQNVWEDVSIPYVQVEVDPNRDKHFISWLIRNDPDGEGRGGPNGTYRALVRAHLGEECHPARRLTDWATSETFSVSQ